MNELTILIDQGQNEFRPGSPLAGTIRWQLAKPPEVLSLRLLWSTSGKGSTDTEQLSQQDFSSRQNFGTERFQFILPASPYSFSGRLISLVWALELNLRTGKETARTEFVLSPSGREILLAEIAQPAPKASFGLFKPRS